MPNMTISLDATTKKSFSEFCDDIGLSASSVLLLYIKTVVRERRIPFPIEAPRVPNAETIAAMEEGERIAQDPKSKGYTDLDAMWKDLLK